MSIETDLFDLNVTYRFFWKIEYVVTIHKVNLFLQKKKFISPAH